MNKMKAGNSRAWMMIALLLIGAPVLAGGAKRWAGRGAAGGAVLGFLVGGDLGSAAEGAAIGAATGAVGGAISDSNQRKRANKAELEELRRREAERQAETQLPSDLPQTHEAWLVAIGPDNVNALDALVECQHDRARLLAQAGATSSNPDFALVGHWLEALVALDKRDPAAEDMLGRLIDLDNDIDNPQQASLAANQAILEIRRVRESEGVNCAR